MEDLNLYLKDVLAERPHTRVPSADTVLRGIESKVRLRKVFVSIKWKKRDD
jgi:hypothetical protein